MNAIETVYNGYKFRSRTEARWAVFFDALKIKYEYEIEGFKFDNGVMYLPDFYLPEYRCFMEIKHSGILTRGSITEDWFTTDEGRKYASLCDALLSGKNGLYDYAILASGTPYESIIEPGTESGLVFSGKYGIMDYEREKFFAKDGISHMPITLNLVDCVYRNGEECSKLLFTKAWYRDFESWEGRAEIIPIGNNLISLFQISHGIILKNNGKTPFDTNGMVYAAVSTNEDGPIYDACIKSRMARFEYGACGE